ncbi:MAG: DUF349 domain-containing protein [Algoriphagus sp.]|nr:DUF349 domain-containing protein [Algoriphagus sp.]
MTEKSNDLSGKDKVTQASEQEDAKSINSEKSPQDSGDSADEISDEEVQEEPILKVESVVEPEPVNEASEVAVDSTTEEIVPAETGITEEIVESPSEIVAPEPVADVTEIHEDHASISVEEEEEDHSEEHIDLSHLSKLQLVNLLKDKISHGNITRIDKIVHDIKAVFDELVHKDKEEALSKFQEEGGSEDEFEYRPSDDEREFNKHYFEYRNQLGSLRKETERQKEKNLALKTELLNKLRELVDGEETTLSMSSIKAIQDQWKSIGPVPVAQNKSLWASFNALMDRFYDNRSIYFELKELDRKKNLEHKTELCEKAEALKEVKDLKDAIKALNELHDEFKNIGPVPREAQEALWNRFKTASDMIYDRRKDFYDGQKEVFKKNQDEKEALIEILKTFMDFKADRIKDWNTKTKEILEIQKNWEKIGPVPREAGKEINKAFWAAFKQFFHNKNLFFKELDEIRASNQANAEALIAKAEELKDSTDWQNAANAFMKLQQDWKILGPTPEKSRDALYKKFKAACDAFFESRRSTNKASNSEFESNLTKKQDICKRIQEAAGVDSPSEEHLTQLISEFNEVGFVPRKNMKDMQAQFKTAVDSYLEKLNPAGSDKEDFLFRLNLNKIQADPNSIKTLNKKEHGIRKQIADLENSVTLWRNNLDFFAASKTADKLRDQFDIKIQKAEEEIDKLKKKLSILKEF